MNTQINLIYVVFYYSDFIHIIYIYIYIYIYIHVYIITATAIIKILVLYQIAVKWNA